MHLYAQIYEFSASIGALEGYVYGKNSRGDVDMDALDAWTRNLSAAFSLLPPEVLEAIRPRLDLTLNRAAGSIENFLEENHEILKRLAAMTGQRKAVSPDAFQKTKWFQKDKA